ncbi:hypothetical protein B0H13DRAFT_1873700 [Mycena leptocephala]|nr:hypothetical protein B0H13DRAFT_1873700 [Mycena leptocephala]
MTSYESNYLRECAVHRTYRGAPLGTFSYSFLLFRGEGEKCGWRRRAMNGGWGVRRACACLDVDTERVGRRIRAGASPPYAHARRQTLPIHLARGRSCVFQCVQERLYTTESMAEGSDGDGWINVDMRTRERERGRCPGDTCGWAVSEYGDGYIRMRTCRRGSLSARCRRDVDGAGDAEDAYAVLWTWHRLKFSAAESQSYSINFNLGLAEPQRWDAFPRMSIQKEHRGKDSK